MHSINNHYHYHYYYQDKPWHKNTRKKKVCTNSTISSNHWLRLCGVLDVYLAEVNVYSLNVLSSLLWERIPLGIGDIWKRILFCHGLWPNVHVDQVVCRILWHTPLQDSYRERCRDVVYWYEPAGYAQRRMSHDSVDSINDVQGHPQIQTESNNTVHWEY